MNTNVVQHMPEFFGLTPYAQSVEGRSVATKIMHLLDGRSHADIESILDLVKRTINYCAPLQTVAITDEAALIDE